MSLKSKPIFSPLPVLARALQQISDLSAFGPGAATMASTAATTTVANVLTIGSNTKA